MKKPLATRIAAVATTAALVIAVPATAFAQTEPLESMATETDRPDHLVQLQRRALEAIDARLDAIARWTAAVDTDEHLTADHRARLLADLSAAARGLTALAGDIEEVSGYSELGGLIPKIVEDYWVFALLGPKVHLVVASDVMTHITQRFEEAAGSIQEAIDRVDSAGYDPSEAQAALGRMQAHLVAASTLIEPVPGTVLGLQSAEMPEAGQQLRGAQADLQSAGEELRAAQQAARQAIEALKDAVYR